MVILGRGEAAGHPVDRSRRRSYDPFHACADRRFKNVERPVGHHFERQTWLLGALRQSDRRQVEQEVDPLHGLSESGAIPNVGLNERDLTLSASAGQILDAATAQIIEDDDFAGAGADEQIGDVRANEPGAAGDEYAGSAELVCVLHAWLTGERREPPRDSAPLRTK